MKADQHILAVVPVRAVSVANLREHWSVKAKRAKQHREAAWAALAQATSMGRYPHERMPVTRKFVVTLTRMGKRKLDTANLASSLKACRDGVADWLSLDDGSDLIEWRYAQAVDKEYRVIVEVA